MLGEHETRRRSNGYVYTFCTDEQSDDDYVAAGRRTRRYTHANCVRDPHDPARSSRIDFSITRSVHLLSPPPPHASSSKERRKIAADRYSNLSQHSSI